MQNDIQEASEFAARLIFGSGSFLVNLEEGFEIAIHQELPEAPRSPFYLNLRPKGVKQGRMKPTGIRAVARAMRRLGEENGLLQPGRAVCDIPQAGTPFLDALLDRQQELKGAAAILNRFHLQKEMVGGKRSFRVVGGDTVTSQEVLLVDDLVTSSLTKRLAIQAIEQAGGRVKDLLVFLNRSADAKYNLNELGVTLHAVWEFDDLLKWALENQYLNRNQYEAIKAYPDQLMDYKKSVSHG